MLNFRIILVVLLASLAAEFPAFSQADQPADPLQYADLADLSVAAPIIAHITVNKALKVEPERSLNAPSGTQRLYIIADTNTLIRGQGGIGDTIRYVIDVPLDERGRVPKLKKKPFIIFARNSSRDGDVQLIAEDAQIKWTPVRDKRVRSLVREIVARDAPPEISGIGSAFHVPGTIIGEGESQIFLETATNQPVSITILSRDGRQKIWAVSLSEIVDEAARAPLRNSLLWYRLACFLPRQLPESALSGETGPNANQARRDYQMVIQDLGNCPRSRRPSRRP